VGICRAKPQLFLPTLPQILCPHGCFDPAPTAITPASVITLFAATPVHQCFQFIPAILLPASLAISSQASRLGPQVVIALLALLVHRIHPSHDSCPASSQFRLLLAQLVHHVKAGYRPGSQDLFALKKGAAQELGFDPGLSQSCFFWGF
jgi:hypothetical protein